MSLPVESTTYKCLNCGETLHLEHKFCPNCGQKVQASRITFGQFVSELLSGLVNYESKLWKTLSVLLIHPGKFPKDYINGQRARYMNPFRLYISSVVLFFIVYGAYDYFNPINVASENEEMVVEQQLAPYFNEETRLFKNSFVSEKVRQIDSLQTTGRYGAIEGLEKLDLPKTNWNQFLYNKLLDIRYSITNFPRESNRMWNKFLSQLSISLFFLIPIFALFFKLMYWRKKMYFMEHLVFIFNIQTCFTIMGIIYLALLWIFGSGGRAGFIFMISFAVYLFLALKSFYNQGYLKTFVKYSILNTIMFFLVLSASMVVALTTLVL